MAKRTPVEPPAVARTTRPAAPRKRASAQAEASPAAITSVDADAQLVTFPLRVSTRFRRELKRWAVDEDTSVQALLIESLQTLRRERGLPELID